MLLAKIVSVFKFSVIQSLKMSMDTRLLYRVYIVLMENP